MWVRAVVEDVSLAMENTSPEEFDDQEVSDVESLDEDAGEVKIESAQTSPSATNTATKHAVKTTAHLQKRRRVTRACDECRRKKIKCDGKQPCTHCTVYSYGMHTKACLYSSTDPSRRLHLRPAIQPPQESCAAICGESRA